MRALSHVEIGVRDLERSRRFYVDLLALEPQAEAPGELQLDGVKLVEVEPFTAVGGGRIAFFPDPDGTQLELVQGTPDYHRTWSASSTKRSRTTAPRWASR